MAKVVIDIETLGYPLESFDKERQEYLLKFAETDAEREEAIQNSVCILRHHRSSPSDY